MLVGKTVATKETWRDPETGLDLYQTGFCREISIGRNFIFRFFFKLKVNKNGKAVLDLPVIIYVNEIEDATGLPGPCLGTINFTEKLNVKSRKGVFENEKASDIVLKMYDADIRYAKTTSARLARLAKEA